MDVHARGDLELISEIFWQVIYRGRIGFSKLSWQVVD